MMDFDRIKELWLTGGCGVVGRIWAQAEVRERDDNVMIFVRAVTNKYREGTLEVYQSNIA